MTDQRIFERENVTDGGVARTETIETEHLSSGPRGGDAEAGGAVAGGAVGAVAGAVVGGPIGAVVGGAIGAASGATVGLINNESKGDEVVVKREERRW
ncbi:MAG: hypothetical protein ACYDAK_09660 [Candidatus Limnocylindrales bacterium]|nr:hypothetical protein [Chloroflexota bacterium]